MRQRPVRLQFAPAAPDHHRQFHLPVQPLRHGGVVHHIVIWPVDGARVLREHHRVFRQLAAHAGARLRFLHMVGVIPAQANHILPRARYRRQQAHILHRHADAAAGAGDKVAQFIQPARAGVNQRQHVGITPAPAVMQRRQQRRIAVGNADVRFIPVTAGDESHRFPRTPVARR